ncbi:penicillin acylase family protein, partial [Candidatus Sumerlaeota bacterium]|nr:penicillin acylase family protein [Candidatus Sumerlaeota bacterium]
MNSHIPRALRGIILLSLCLFVIEADANEPLKPDYRELAKKVEIRRDEWGVPHILAPSEEAAALAMGYVQGEDYPLLLSQLFAAARGESAKYFGEKEESKDLRIKSLRLYEDSFERFHELKPNLQAILNAFAAGYDMAIEKYLGEKPPYMRAIEGPDVLAHGRNIVVLEFTMNIGRFAIIKNPAKNGTNSAQATLDGSAMAHALDPYSTDPLPGSNMWAIGKERSASGRGILLANPHLNWAGAQTF